MGTLYDRRVLNDPTVRLSYGDPLIPIIQPDQVTLELSNEDRYFDVLDLSGEQISFDHFDRLSNETWAELTGKVASQELMLDRVILRCVTYDLDAFQTLLPKEVVTASVFPLAHPQQGLGKPIPIVFGNAVSTNKVNDAWEMAYVGENTGINQYDYLVGRGTFTNITAYRDTIGDTLFVVPSAEYAVNTTAYPGFTVLRFTLRQTNFGGGLHRIFVAADGLQAERNFARALQSLLSNSTWGLGLLVNTASFDTAAAALDAIGSLFCDGVMDAQRTAYDWITQLVNVRGIRLETNAAAEYTATVDTMQSAIKGRFGHGQGQAWNGVVAGGFRGLSTTPVNEAIKSLVLEYRRDRWSDKYVLATSSRSILAVGTDKRVQHDFIRDRTTADKTAGYWANRYFYEKERLAFTGDQMARKLRPGELIQYHSITPAFSKTFRVFDLSRRLVTSDIRAIGWNSAIYTYSVGTLPAEPAAITETDYTRQTPSFVTSLVIAASGVETDGQNAYLAKVTLQYTVPVESWAQTIVRYRRTGTTNWQTAAINQATGAGLQTQITGLITGANYDYQVSRVNVTAPSLSASVTLIAGVDIGAAPTDTTAPGAPTSLIITDQHLKTLMVEFTPPSDKDVKYWHWEIRTAASGGGSLIDEGDTEGNGAQIKLTLNQVAYSTTRYIRIRGHDFSGNTGTYSASLSFSFSQIVTADVGTGQITTEAVGSNQITVDAAYSNDAGYVLNTSSESEIGTIAVATNGGAVMVHAKFNIWLAAGGGVTAYLRKDSLTGTIIDQIHCVVPSGTYEMYLPISMVGRDASPSSSQTYKVGARLIANNGTAEYRRMYVANLKR